MKDKVIVITGGLNGVGKAVAIECAKRGSIVVIADRNEEDVSTFLKEAVMCIGSFSFIKTNLERVEECKFLFDETNRRFDRLDGFFNYAGITPSSSLLDCEESHFNAIFNINTRGALFCCKYALKYMIASGGGSIVLTGSPHAWAGEKDRVAYACSKGAIVTLSDHIAKHYAKNGIRSNYVTMGWTPTEGEIELRKSMGMSEIQLREWASTIIPAGRMTEVNDLAPGIVYLLSDDSKMVSGSNLRITGGWFI